MRVQKCMAVDKRADELLRVSPVSFLLSLYLWNMLRVRSLAREENFVEEIFSLTTASPPEIVRLQFLSVPGFDTYIYPRSVYLPRSTCIPNLHSNVSHRRFGLSSNVLSSPRRDFFASFFLFSDFTPAWRRQHPDCATLPIPLLSNNIDFEYDFRISV